MAAIKDLLKAIWRSIKVAQSVTGTLIFLILLIVVINVLFLESVPKVQKGSALTVDIRGFVVEQKRTRDPFATLLGAQRDLPPEVEMRDIARVINAAKDDERISTLVLRLDNMFGAGPSQLHEIGDLVDDFKESGKPVLAYGDFYSQGQYLAASHADKVYMSPGGVLLLSGYGIYPTYFKAGLDMIKARFHVFRVGEYKTAGEPYLRNEMSPEAREANAALLDDLWQAYLEDVAKNRQVAMADLEADIENQDLLLREEGGSFAKLALRVGLLDELMTPDGFQAEMRKRVGRNGNSRGYKSITFKNYLRAIGPGPTASDRVAVVVVNGIITDGERPKGNAGGDTVARQLRKARKNDRVKAVVLRVDSPGGSTFASEQIRREVELIRLAGKPIVVSMGVAAASGGYWISLASDEIWASATTITGSIGIIAIIPTFEDSLKEIGINVDGIGTTKFSGAFSPARELSDPVKDIINQSIQQGYKQFVAQVAQSRGLSFEAVDAVARGRVWSGLAAKELGLIDRLGGLREAIDSAAERAELSKFEIVYVEDTPTFEENLAEFLEKTSILGSRPQSTNPGPIQFLIATLNEDLRAILALNDPKNVYALCLVCQLSR
jgi:protease-4